MDQAHLAHKREVYFACGTLLMIVIDPRKRTLTVYEPDGSSRTLTEDDTLASDAFPDMHIALRPIFTTIDFP